MSIFSERLKELRNKQKVTQTELASAIGITDRACRRYEAGENEPSITILHKISDFFNVSSDYLLGRSDDPTRH